ncbi:MAG: hypothetical protein FJZ61_03130 [Chlamydiae bacterium]|nr:hypothetical protein [Chlamydiota bacterium]
MSKSLKSLHGSLPLNKTKALANLSKNINENTICYVLITCEKPQKDGSMHVDLVFEGDKHLAQHLLQTAQTAFKP